jgi:phosphoglucosamine mutase
VTRWFGTDGIRGPAGLPPLDPEGAFAFGWALGTLAKEAGARRTAIAWDTRPSSPGLARAMAEGAAASGLPVDRLGVLPTPGAALWALHEGAWAAVITASHNPVGDNGYKVFTDDGRKLAEELEEVFENRMMEAPGRGAADGPGLDRSEAARGLLLEHWLALPGAAALGGLRVALDMAHGSTAGLARVAFEAAGAVVLGGLGEGGGVINEGVGATHPEALAAALSSLGADWGFGFDGDGDRVVLVHRESGAVDGDRLLGAIALRLAAEGRLGEAGIVVTRQSNSGLDASLEAAGVPVHRSAVGDRSVSVMMRALGARFGGEESGHLVLSEALPTGDGVAAALTIASFLCSDGRAFEQALDRVWLRPASARSLPAPRKPDLDALPELERAVAEVQTTLAGSGVLLLRYSGTEPLLRVRAEASSPAAAQAAVAAIDTVWRRIMALEDGP